MARRFLCCQLYSSRVGSLVTRLEVLKALLHKGRYLNYTYTDSLANVSYQDTYR